MVGKTLPRRLGFPAVVLALLMPLAASLAPAQEIGEESAYAIREEYRVELDEVGDAHITDTLTYDEGWFAEYGFLFEENPNLLTRRYRADSNVGEVEDFDVDIDSGDSTITVTFDTPGLAYNLEQGWTVFGYGDYELVDEGPDEVVLQSAWTITNEYSLFETMGLEEEVVIDLPDGARNADYDEESGAVEYDLEYAAKGSGALAENQTLFTVIFAVVMALALIMLLYLFTRRAGTEAGAETGAAGAAATMPPVVAQTPSAQSAVPSSAAGEATRFCKKCGYVRGDPGERFCRKCGAPHT